MCVHLENDRVSVYVCRHNFCQYFILCARMYACMRVSLCVLEHKFPRVRVKGLVQLKYCVAGK